MRSLYPLLPQNPSAQDIQRWIEEVTRLRQTEDVADFTNLPNVFVRGRLVERAIPASSTDVVSTDVLGDWLYSTTFLYILINDSGTPKWARINANVSW